MKTIYLLFVIIANDQGYETMTPVTNTKHNSMIACKAEKVQHKGIENKVQFFCGDESKFFNKQQKFY